MSNQSPTHKRIAACGGRWAGTTKPSGRKGRNSDPLLAVSNQPLIHLRDGSEMACSPAPLISESIIGHTSSSEISSIEPAVL